MVSSALRHHHTLDGTVGFRSQAGRITTCGCSGDVAWAWLTRDKNWAVVVVAQS